MIEMKRDDYVISMSPPEKELLKQIMQHHRATLTEMLEKEKAYNIHAMTKQELDDTDTLGLLLGKGLRW
jgi:hypothetical protein